MFTGWFSTAVIFFLIALALFLGAIWLSGDISLEEKDSFDDEHFL
jgi:hypothetical protein